MEGSGAFTDLYNTYSATMTDAGYTVTCTHNRGSPTRETIRNTTKGTAAQGTGSLFFEFGDYGSIWDGDEDRDQIWVMRDVRVPMGERTLTVKQSVDKGLQGYVTTETLESQYYTKSEVDELIRRLREELS